MENLHSKSCSLDEKYAQETDNIKKTHILVLRFEKIFPENCISKPTRPDLLEKCWTNYRLK